MNNGFNMNGWQNPLNARGQYFGNTAIAPHYGLLKVKGAESARNFRMAPNSEAILVDETAPLVWHAQTDSTGYLTLMPYTITPYQEEQKPQIDMNDVLERLKKLEDNYELQSTTSTKQNKHQRQQPNDKGNS